MMRPPLLFPDMAAWAVGYLARELAARPEPYTDGVTVRTQRGENDNPSGRVVTVRDDGGAEQPDVTKVVALGLNVWAPTQADCSDLALMVAALLRRSPGDGPVVAVDGTSGPYPLPDSTSHHRYLSADLMVSGIPL